MPGLRAVHAEAANACQPSIHDFCKNENKLIRFATDLKSSLTQLPPVSELN